MASSLTELFNQALSIAGARGTVAIPDERSREAEVCRTWYDTVRRNLIRAAPWGSATLASRLSVLAEQTTDQWVSGAPKPGHRFAYALPDKMLRPQYLYGFAPFTLGLLTEDRQAIFTDVENAILVHSIDQTSVPLFDTDFGYAIAHALGGMVTMPLTGKMDRAQLNISLANQAIMDARVASANIPQQQFDTIPEWIAARGYGQSADSTRFIYPFGSVLALPSVR